MTTAFEAGAIPPIEVRHRLRIAREYAGLDQEELAAAMQVTRSTVSNAETGKVAPQRMTINLWAMATGVPASWIRTGLPPIRPDGGDPSNLRTEDYQPVVTGCAELRSDDGQIIGNGPQDCAA